MGKGKMKRTRCPSCNNGKRGGYRSVTYTDEKGKKFTRQEYFEDLPCPACDSSGSLTVWVEGD